MPPVALKVVPDVLGHCSAASGILHGLALQPVRVEVSSRRGPSGFELAGLAEASVREARIRVGSALCRLGLRLDEYALTVSLAPAAVRKGGSALDLALAVAILGAVGRIPTGPLADSLFIGELGLDGSIRAIAGVLPLLDGARRRGARSAFVPLANAREAAQLSALDVRPAASLEELVRHLDGSAPLPPALPSPYSPGRHLGPALEDIRGQESAKRALVVAAAGHHHLLLVGPPGSGKSLLARRLPGLLPPLGLEAALEATAVHSVAGLVDPARGIVDTPPFRAPHHTVSDAGLVGGGSHPRPGELSLAHGGVLFLDELPEFRRSALEALRQPLEEHRVRVVRARMQAEFPARPLLVAAMNPCPCGHHGNPRVACRCSAEQRSRYLAKLSGPLLDRIDLHVVVPPASIHEWVGATGSASGAPAAGQTSAELRAQVLEARARQVARHARGLVAAPENALLELADLERVAQPSAGGVSLLSLASERLGLSARGYVRVLRVARTLADLEGEDAVLERHFAEAIRYRALEPRGSSPSDAEGKETP